MIVLQQKRDDLSREARRELYAPENYIVERDSPQEFRAVNVPTGAEFSVWMLDGGMNIRSNTNGTHFVDFMGTCDCPDFEYRAFPEGRRCKHSCVAEAVEEFCRLEGATERHADAVRRGQAETEADRLLDDTDGDTESAIERAKTVREAVRNDSSDYRILTDVISILRDRKSDRDQERYDAATREIAELEELMGGPSIAA